MIAIYFITAIVVLGLHLYISSVAANIAHDKGYAGEKWFHICFWFSVFGFIIVAAMPDLKARELQQETNQLLIKIAGAQGVSTTVQSVEQQNDVASCLPEL